jgi:pyrroline-5-carboxylate reductase
MSVVEAMMEAANKSGVPESPAKSSSQPAAAGKAAMQP